MILAHSVLFLSFLATDMTKLLKISNGHIHILSFDKRQRRCFYSFIHIFKFWSSPYKTKHVSVNAMLNFNVLVCMYQVKLVIHKNILLKRILGAHLFIKYFWLQSYSYYFKSNIKLQNDSTKIIIITHTYFLDNFLELCYLICSIRLWHFRGLLGFYLFSCKLLSCIGTTTPCQDFCALLCFLFVDLLSAFAIIQCDLTLSEDAFCERALCCYIFSFL
jgi:hypothetical protein